MARKTKSPPDELIIDPRRKAAWDGFVDPRSPTYGNMTQSGIAAGFDEAYSRQLSTAEWWLAKVRRMNLFRKSEKVLEEMLTMPVETLKWGNDNSEDEHDRSIVTTNPALVKIKQDTAKFVAERLGKDDGYSTRNEVTGEGGGPIIVMTPEEKAKADSVLNEFFNTRNPR